MVTNGRFAETQEAVGGFDILECGSLDEAVEIAAAHPVAQSGTIEVRPLWGKLTDEFCGHSQSFKGIPVEGARCGVHR